MPLPLFVSRSCPALLSVPLAGSDRVTLRYSVIASLVLTSNSSRLSLSAKTTYCRFFEDKQLFRLGDFP